MNSPLSQMQTARPTTASHSLQNVWLWIVTYVIANISMGTASMAIITFLLPLHITKIAPQQQTFLFSLVVTCGALANVLANPLTGMLIDRSSWGTRNYRLWMLIGSVFLSVGLLLASQAHTIGLLTTGIVVSQFGVGVIMAALSAFLPGVPIRRRAITSGLAGMAPMVGNVFGQALGAHTNLSSAYLLLLEASIMFLIVFLFSCQEKAFHQDHAQLAPDHVQQQRTSKRLRLTRDFVLTWISRLFLFLSFTTTLNYLAFFLLDIKYPQTSGQPLSTGLQIFFLLFTASLLIGSFAAGWLSDHLQKRKIFVIAGSLSVMVTLLLFMLTRNWSGIPLLAILFGLSMAIFLSSDLALVTQILPAQEDAARDLGWMNTCIFLPMVLGPLVAGLILEQTHNSYVVLFAVLACFAAPCRCHHVLREGT
ncbi:MFS transporter [Ktedonobacter racemifer]|uniref:Major facilitator superfamily MFS_1 n=1 Tax=Ktedonobacter racemifer DSM 44963 TaxID=485913 RepID=D6TBA8_KTERA|nr:MFS transporter [Ktedonobacter racemifer]EFH87892.1 major facilitator superfamily MFS_1 [Ktedonobacter racemifer DSM 44963]